MMPRLPPARGWLRAVARPQFVGMPLVAITVWRYVREQDAVWLWAAVAVAIATLVGEHRWRRMQLRSVLAGLRLADVASPLPQVFAGERSLVADAALVRTFGAGHLSDAYARRDDRVLVLPARALHDPWMVRPSHVGLVRCAREAPVVDGSLRVRDLPRLPGRHRPIAVEVGDLIVGKVTAGDLHAAARAVARAPDPGRPSAEQSVPSA